MNQIKQMKQAIKKDTRNKLSHLNQIDTIEDIFKNLQIAFNKLDIENGKGLDYLIQRIQIRVLTDALTDTVKSIILLLKEGLFNGSDPLARVSLEHSINLLYLLGGKKHDRSKEMIKNYIDSTLRNSERWYEYALKSQDKDSIAVSKKKVAYLQKLKDGYTNLYDGTCKKWPNAHDRFLKCGHEDAYRTLFSMNSDSIHSLSEDVYNFNTLPSYPEELQSLMANNFKAINASLAVYHGIKSVYFYGLVIKEISTKLLNSTEEDNKIIDFINSLAPLLDIHENDFANNIKERDD